MKVLQRYFGSEIIRSVFFMLLALLLLTSFFTLMEEAKSVSRDGYQIHHALMFVVLNMPSSAYEFMPVAVLIGSIYVLATFAGNSEFTIMRAAGMSPRNAAMILGRISLVFIVATFLLGEVIAPKSAEMAKKMKMAAINSPVNQKFQSGIWAKDTIREDGLQGTLIGTRFLNVREIISDSKASGTSVLKSVKIYEFDKEFRLLRQFTAARAEYAGNHIWRMMDVVETYFPTNLNSEEIASNTHRLAQKELLSEITPEILSVLFIEPEKMSALQLIAYTKHLTESKQATDRYDIEFWRKMTYPVCILVMMALALPFAYLHARDGGISLRIFGGIMLGMFFFLTNKLFFHLGLINNWPALFTSLFPSLLFFVFAYAGLRYVQRH